MTNRDYLRSLSNEKLAELLERSGVCDCLIGLIETCPNGDCTKCITNWLGAEKEIHVEKENDGTRWKSLFHNQWNV